ncbi:FAD-dependent oxidoreductase [Maritalea sp.]|uniref:FAD-dependent oxidoreductase n=1 Tax=Maritalea sp. TaxID=2003361 RepID=UPI003EF19D68
MQDFRFPADERSPFKGALIDRNQIIQFRLNKRLFHGFSGDTVFTALLANGVNILRGRGGKSIPLNQQTAGQIKLLSHDGEKLALSAAELPITDGMKIKTPNGSNSGVFGKLFKGSGARNTLQYSLAEAEGAEERSLSVKWGEDQDIVVVGGGIAGLQAAIVAGRAGRRVLLLEKSSRLGGMCDYYGRAEDEEAPKDLVNRLCAELSDMSNVTVNLCVEVTDVRRNTLLVSDKNVGGSEINSKSDFCKFRFEKLIIAVGANYGTENAATRHIIGVNSAAETFRLAADYGIRPANGLALITGGNSAYRLAMLLKENGVEIDQLLDKRINPTSRHIDFAKAVGVLMQFGQVPKSISAGKQGVEVELQEVADTKGKLKLRKFASLLLSDAPRPNYFLWVRSGGMSAYDKNQKHIIPFGRVQNVEIVGSAKGLTTQHECLNETQLSVAQQLELKQIPSKKYTGINQYETMPQSFAGDLRESPVSSIRSKSGIPDFVGDAHTEALSEFQFQNMVTSRSVRQTINIEQQENDTTSFEDSNASNESDFLGGRLGSRFASPKSSNLLWNDNIVLQAGQMIFDGDGVDKTPELVGIVIRNGDLLSAIVEDSMTEAGQKVFIQTRSGLHSASLSNA